MKQARLGTIGFTVLLFNTAVMAQVADPRDAEARREAIAREAERIWSEMSSDESPELTSEGRAEQALRGVDSKFWLVLLGRAQDQAETDEELTNFRRARQWRHEVERFDKQLGSNASSSGSSSAVSSGSIARFLSFAVEHGALLRSTDGTSVTFRTTPARLIDAFTQSTPPRWTKALSTSFTFDTSRGGPSGEVAGSSDELAQFSLRVDVWNHRDPFGSRWLKRWKEFTQSDAAKTLTDAVGTASSRLLNDPLFLKARGRLAEQIALAQDRDEVEQLLHGFASRHADLGRLIRPASEAVFAAWETYYEEKKDVFGEVMKSPIFAFEYVLDRAPQQEAEMVTEMMARSQRFRQNAALPDPPDLSTFRFIYQQGIGNHVEAALNASASIFNQSLEGVGRLRDLQLGGQVDIATKEIPHLGKGVLTLAGLFVSLQERPFGVPLVINDQQVGEKGNIGLLQARFSIPVGDAVRIPLSLSWANRTELNSEQDVRGSFGFTLDLDKILLKP